MTECERHPEYSLAGCGFRERECGTRELIEEAQMFFYADGGVSGSFVCRTSESNGILWLFRNGHRDNTKIQFDMVHIELRYPRDPVATFVGEYDGEGTFGGIWSSPFGETGRWILSLRDKIKPHDPGPHWYS